MSKPKPKPKHASWAALSRYAHESMTPAQRIARGKKAAAARWKKVKPPPDRPKPGSGYSLVALPIGYVWKGVARALEDIRATPEVILWSRDRAEVMARLRQEDMRDRVTDIVECDPPTPVEGGRL